MIIEAIVSTSSYSSLTERNHIIVAISFEFHIFAYIFFLESICKSM